MKKFDNGRKCKGLPGCVENFEKEKVSLSDKVKSLIKATGEHISNGMKNVDDSIYIERTSICKDCEFLVKERNACEKCGCYIPIKARWEVSKCPINKWKK